MEYRCPIDDVVFTAETNNRKPTLVGHPDCPGPSCRATFANYVPGKAEATIEAPAAKPAPAATPAPAASLGAPPLGQGW